ncbi:MAG: hypothetical protein HY000_19505 [Planctomycetes bacterium]|nr:hypothetical protein [Planctomycetota bacterium]
MRTRYLLPCSCGRNLQVDASQSGLTVECVCGAKLEVPAMRGLTMLEHVPEQSSGSLEETAPWGPRQGLMFLGGAILAVGLGLVTFFAARMPPEPAPDPKELADLQQQVDSIQPSEIFEIWDQQFRGGIGVPLTQSHEVYRHLLTERKVRLTLASGLALVGLALLGAGALYKREEPSRTSISPSQPSAAGPNP